MAYFPNGTSGEILEVQCCECLHKDIDTTCPIYYVQSVFNYKQSENRDLEVCLGLMINDKGICQMKKILDRLLVVDDDRSDLEKFDSEKAV